MYRLTVVYDEPADKEAFDRRYTDEHVPLVKAVPGLGSFQLSHPQGGTPYLVAELFWPSEDASKASAATPEMAETRKHAEGCGTTFTVYTGDVAEVDGMARQGHTDQSRLLRAIDQCFPSTHRSPGGSASLWPRIRSMNGPNASILKRLKDRCG